MDPEKTRAIEDWPQPRNIREIQVFLGFTNFYRRFIKDYATLTKPLTNLLKKSQTFSWNADQDAAFKRIKQVFSSQVILAHPDTSRPFVVETDASDYAVGGVLSQMDDDQNLRPVAFYSRQFLPAECNYEIYDKELLGVYDCFKEWRHFLQGAQHKITVLCDHKNLQYFMSSKQLTRRQARWAMFFTEFDFVLTHRPGSRNGNADFVNMLI